MSVDAFWRVWLTRFRLWRSARRYLRYYEPEKGWLAHIERAHHLGDHDETIAEIRAALVKFGEKP